MYASTAGHTYNQLFLYTELCNNIKRIKRKSCLKVITLVHCCKQVGKGAEPEGEGN